MFDIFEVFVCKNTNCMITVMCFIYTQVEELSL